LKALLGFSSGKTTTVISLQLSNDGVVAEGVSWAGEWFIPLARERGLRGVVGHANEEAQSTLYERERQ
jgi:hypothetical protein